MEKMYVIMLDGTKKEVDTSSIFANQYDVINENGTTQRVMDEDIMKIENDIRLGEYYTGANTNGSYDEVVKAIAEKRAKIKKCFDCNGKSCFWWQIKDSEIIKKDKTFDLTDGSAITTDIKKWTYECKYIDKYNKKCEYDIDDKPVLFREKNSCFFCKYPNGIPDNKELGDFIITNAERYELYKRGENSKGLTHKSFGSYIFELDWNYFNKGFFSLYNTRQSFLFRINLENGLYLIKRNSSYNYAYQATMPIPSFDKFDKWFKGIIKDYRKEGNK